jgi:arginine-tRNA-protein transferase
MNVKGRDMFAQVHCPAALAPHELDAYLERGWFRMRQNIFTTNFVHFKDQFYSALWLRVTLADLKPDSSRDKLFRQNAIFRTEIRPASVTDEKEALYTRYREQIPFEPMASLRQLLYGDVSTIDIYNSFEVAVYDGDNLIAIGFFDVGGISAAGIVSVYDPAYKKYSLGKYLIYLKMEYCKKMSLQYFYPGYFVPGYKAFDYKLTIGRSALHFLALRSQEWISIDRFSQEYIPYAAMQNKLDEVQRILGGRNLESKVLKYEFFDANLFPELRNAALFDFPVMLICSDAWNNDLNHVIVFDVRDAHFHLLQCIPVYIPNIQAKDPDFYSEYIIKEEHEIFSSSAAQDIVDWMVDYMTHRDISV